jgi:hypothetical protein
MVSTVGYSLMPELSIRLGAGGYLPKDTAVFDSLSTIALSAGFLEGSACWVNGRDTWRLQACIGSDVGILRAEGKRIDNPSNQSAAYVTALMEVGYGYRAASGVGVFGTAMAGLSPLRPRFGVSWDDKPTPVYRPELAVFRLGAGVFWE